MPAHSRQTIVNSDVVGHYHCISRCVRRAFLCGVDPLTGKSYEHRKDLTVARMTHLEGVFFVEVGSYAVMSNHLHLVLRNRPDLAANASNEELAKRWWRLFPQKINYKVSYEIPEEVLAKFAADDEWCELRRRRLADISWYMRALAENIARAANKEDKVTGRFWEGRFKCIALLDEEAIKNVSLYVDLNPFRAKIATTPADSNHTSLKERWEMQQDPTKSSFLIPLPGRNKKSYNSTNFVVYIGCTSAQYIDLALDLMKVESDLLAKKIRSCPTAMGSKENMEAFANRAGLKWIKGIKTAS